MISLIFTERFFWTGLHPTASKTQPKIYLYSLITINIKCGEIYYGKLALFPHFQKEKVRLFIFFPEEDRLFIFSIFKVRILWWFVNPGSDSPEISLIRTKSAGTDFLFWTDRCFSNPENLLIQKYRPGTNVSGLTNHHCIYFQKMPVPPTPSESNGRPLNKQFYWWQN